MLQMKQQFMLRLAIGAAAQAAHAHHHHAVAVASHIAVVILRQTKKIAVQLTSLKTNACE